MNEPILEYPDNFIDSILCGDNRVILPQIPGESIQCLITSPPFWGLRDYQLEPVVWDGDPECQHLWDRSQRHPHVSNTRISGDHPRNCSCASCAGTFKKSLGAGQFCQLCGAWLGSLGLEPTPELYIDHLVQIFREVWRVLRKDGTLWVNIGDSYFGGNSTGRQPKDSKGVEASRQTKNTVKHCQHCGIEFTGYPMQRFCSDSCGGVDNTPREVKFGLKPKDLVLIPFRLALALQADGWWIRSDIIWHKPNVMPSSVKDRPTTDFEHVFLCSKSKRYYYDQDAIREPYTEPMDRWGGEKLVAKGKSDWDEGTGQSSYRDRDMRPNPKGRNKRTVWTVNTQPFPQAHFAVFPEKLIEPMILAGSKPGDIVLDPFMGAGTTGVVAKKLDRRWIGIDASPEYCQMADKRIAGTHAQPDLPLPKGGGK